MKKFAILFALFASIGLVQATEVSIVGTMDAGYSGIKAPGSSTTTTSFQSGGMTTSYVGVKGSEDLGNGTKAVFELTSFLNNGTGATQGGTTVNTFARSSFVGLNDSTFGQVTMGRQSAPSFLPVILFNAYGDSGTYGPLWHATYFGNTGNATTQLYNDTAWDNSIAYETPSLGGARVTVTSAKGSTAGTNGGANVLFFRGDLGLTAFYQTTGFNSSGSFQTDIFTNNGNKPAQAAGVGASYDLKVAKVFATYQEAKSESQNMNGKTAQVSALIPAGRGNVMAEYAHSRYDDGTGTTHYGELAVGYDCILSKTVDAYATVGRTHVTAETTGQTVGAGLRVRF